MRFPGNLSALSTAGRDPWRAAILCLAVLTPSVSAAAKSRTPPVFDSGYVSALAVADHFLQAWQSGDLETGMVLLSNRAKNSATTDSVEKFFSDSAPAAYELTRGKPVKRGCYEFPIILVTISSKNAPPHRKFASIVVVNTGGNDWAVDKLP